MFWRKKREQDLERELRAHLELEAEERGDTNAARRALGNTALIQEDVRAEWGGQWLERLAQDLRYAQRMWRKDPGFTFLTLTVLALGIGATTAVFSVVNSILLRPLRFPDPDRLVMVWERPPQGKLTNVVQTQNFLDWRKRNRSFLDIAALEAIPANLEEGGEAVQVPGLLVTAGFFEILRVPPLLGRTIHPEDDVRNAPPVVVLGYELWQGRFGGGANIIGQKVALFGSSCEVIGVMPPGFYFPALAADLYIPMRINPASAPREGRNYSTVARLRPAVSLRDAQADIKSIAAQTAAERPERNAKWSATVVSLMEQTVGDTRTTLLVLLAAVGFVLLIAGANVSNMLLMRAAARRREIAMRMALGAGRWRLLQQLLIESSVLTLAGGLFGFGLAWGGVPAILRMLPAGFPLPRLHEIAVDRGVLAFTFAVSVACGVLFGLIPAWQADRSQVMEGLKAGGRHGPAASRRLRGALVVAEVAGAMLLVIGAGLMLRSFALLHAVNPGFQPERLLAFRMLLLPSKYGPLPRRAAVVAQMLDRVRALPGITSASSIHLLPLTGMQSGSPYYRADRPAPPLGSMAGGDVSVVSDGYFRTMGIPLVAGRDFDTRDRLGSPGVALLNQTAARTIFPNENPIGKRLMVDWSPVTDAEVIGIAGDIRHHGLDTKADPCLFLSEAQNPSLFASLVVRTQGDPVTAVTGIRAQIRAVDPDQGTLDIRPMEEVLSDSIARPKLDLAVLGIFGLLALVLASVGIYAVISYSVEQRRREMGIRLALGAVPGSILRLVVRDAVWLAGIGIVIGTIAALGMTRYLRTLLFAIQPTDPMVFGSVAAVLAAAAIAGCYIPARRATRVDPAVVLREE
jgi:putative ABC transport system permease protein